MTLDETLDALVTRYRPPEWAFLPQVGNATGGNYQRTVDAIALNLWPSRGMELYGFEIKVDRGDWLRELKDPEKPEVIAAYCDRWWVVTADKDIVRDGELPAAWGLLVPRGKSLICEVEPQKLPAKELDRTFIAATLRRVTETMTPAAKIEAARRAGFEAGRKDTRENAELTYKDLRNRVKAFQEASGVKIDTWNVGEIGEAVQAVLKGPLFVRDLRRLRSTAQDIVQRIDQGLKDVTPEALADVD